MPWDGVDAFTGSTGTYPPMLELEASKTFPALLPCLQDLLNRKVDARPLAFGLPLIDLIKLKKREYQNKSPLQKKTSEFGLALKRVELASTRFYLLIGPTEITLSADIKRTNSIDASFPAMVQVSSLL